MALPFAALAVPEPGSIALAGLALGLLGFSARNKPKKVRVQSYAV